MKYVIAAIFAIALSVSAAAAYSGIISKPKQYRVPETLDRLEAVLEVEGSHGIYPDRPQWRGGKGGPENAA